MMRITGKLLLNVFTIAIAGAIFGVDSGIIATTLESTAFLLYMFPPGSVAYKNANSLTGAVVSVTAAGAAFTCLLSGAIAEKFGRKRPLAISTTFTILGAVLQTASNGPIMMIMGRLVAGMALGVLVPIAPIFITELSQPQIRGRLVSIYGIMIATGFCLANWIGYTCSFAADSVSWRLALAMQIPLALLLQILTIFLPESPRWLAQNEQLEKLTQVLRNVYPDESELSFRSLQDQIIQQARLELAQRRNTTLGYGILELFSRRMILRTATSILILQVPALGGTLAIQNYQSILYKNLGFEGREALLISGFYGFMGLAGQLINSVFISDRLSRRITTLTGGLVLAMLLTILTALSKYYADGSNLAGARTGVALIFIYSASYAAFFNSTVFTIPAEYFPTHLRGYGTALGVFFQNVTNIWLTQITPHVFATITWRYYIVFIACLLALTTFFALFLKETNQARLEEIAEKFGDEVADITEKDSNEPRVREIEES